MDIPPTKFSSATRGETAGGGATVMDIPPTKFSSATRGETAGGGATVMGYPTYYCLVLLPEGRLQGEGLQ